MSKRIKVADLPGFDAAHYLDSETSIAAYLPSILEANDAALLASALGDIARARGMTEIAKTAGITREAPYSCGDFVLNGGGVLNRNRGTLYLFSDS
jgi:probable addiction module antidote protein